MIMKTKCLNSVVVGFIILTIILIPISCSKQERVRSNVTDEAASVSQPVSNAPFKAALRPDGKPSRIEVDMQVWLQSQLKQYGVSDFTTESLLKLLGSEISSVRLLSASLLGERKEISAIPSLEAMLQDESVPVRNAVTTALLKMGNRKGIKVLEEFCEKASKKFDEGDYKNTVDCSHALTVLADANSSAKSHRPGHAEKMILSKLGLKEDVNDTEIIKLLDIPDKSGSAILLIRYRKITTATPKLLQIVNDDKIIIFKRLSAAKALCDFDNKEWMQTLKLLLTDPNTLHIPLHAPLRIDIAGLLARAGDYSQFKIVASHIHHSKRSVRQRAIQALGNFGHKTNPVTYSAVELLASLAVSDPIPWLRERAIYSLEKLTKKKPELTSKVIDALDANIDSPDKNLRRVCRVKLTIYGRKLKTD